MKSWITYIKILITSCLLMTSCIEEEFDIPSEDAANVELRISMPSTDNYTKAGSNTVKPDGSEDATSYENTIVGHDQTEQVFDITDILSGITDVEITEKKGNGQCCSDGQHDSVQMFFQHIGPNVCTLQK